MRKIKHGKLVGSRNDTCRLKLSDVSVSLDGEKILSDISFQLNCGEIVALIGPNGAGKSTLLRTILGQLPYTGSITFSPAGAPSFRLGDPLSTKSSRPLVGYVPQSPTFDQGDPITVLDFFAAATSAWPVFLPIPHTLRAKVSSCLARVQGQELLDKPMGALSGGQLQRVLLALALEPVPHILLLDEPFSGVDTEGQQQLMDMLDQLRTQYDLSIFLSTHDFATLDRYADQVVLLDERVLCTGPATAVLSSPEFYQAFHLRSGKGEQNG